MSTRESCQKMVDLLPEKLKLISPLDINVKIDYSGVASMNISHCSDMHDKFVSILKKNGYQMSPPKDPYYNTVFLNTKKKTATPHFEVWYAD